MSHLLMQRIHLKLLASIKLPSFFSIISKAHITFIIYKGIFFDNKVIFLTQFSMTFLLF